MQNIQLEFDKKSKIFWIGFRACPTKKDVDDIIETILQTSGSLIVHAEHVNENIPMPSFDIILHIFQHLQKHQQTIADRLLGTIIQPYKMNDFTISIINMALQLYKPKKPLCITDDTKKVQKFIKNVHSP